MAGGWWVVVGRPNVTTYHHLRFSLRSGHLGKKKSIPDCVNFSQTIIKKSEQ